MKFLPLLALLASGSLAHAANVYQDQFTGSSIPSAWNNTAGTPVTLDDPNDQLDYSHTAGTTRRFLNYNDLLVGQTGYLKVDISNFTGASSIWLGFVGTNTANNSHYAQTLVAANGTYELFLNNTASPQSFDNNAGWSGTLPAGTGIYSTNGTTTAGTLTLGANFPAAGSNFFGFGFANFGNAAAFPSSSFSIDSISVDDSLIITGTPNNAPVVTITAPADGSNALPGSSVTFTATATDTEDGNLNTALTWSSSIDGALGTGASITTSSLSVGVHTITASATDSGSLTGTHSISLDISTPDNFPPTVSISAPANASTVTTGVPTTFTATGTDPEDGDVSSNIIWTSNLSGVLGTGDTISITNLAVGTHTITAQTSDSEHLTGSATLTITVNASSGTPGALRPNIIVIISDDAGYADFGFMNAHSGSTSEVPTPHLDALAARGITFSRAYVAANCQPTRAAIVTGAYQARIGNENVGNNHFLASQIFEGIPVETDTVWDRMRNLGYTTGAIGKWHLGSIENTPTKLGNRPENQGIDRFFGFWHGSREFTAGYYNFNSDPDHPNQLRYLREALIHPDDSKTDVIKEYTDYANVPSAEKDLTKILGDYAEQFVADHHDDPEPFFLYLAHPAPHKPWTNNSPDYNDPRISGLTPNNRRQVASMMITMDKEIGDLMAKLDDPNGDGNTADSITDNTLVVFLNDNGGVAGMEDGVNGTSNGILNGFKGSAHDGGIRVPMIMAGAGIDPSKIGTVFDKPVHGIDLLPTSVALAGGTIDPSEKIDGVNLIPHLNGQNTALPHDTLVHRWRGTFAVIQDNWKLVNTRNVNASPPFYKLHNLNTDPSETNDISGLAANATRVAEMTREVTHMEANWDKPRYPILNRDLDSEPLNIVDHFTFRPGLHNDWSAGADEQDGPTGANPANWYEGGTTNPEHLLRSDGFAGAILEFPAHSASYTSNNDLLRKTGLEFMLNKIILSGNDTSNKSANLTGNTLIFTNTLHGVAPTINLDATGNFTYDLDLDLILYHDLTITGDGTATLQIDGDLSEFNTGQSIQKTGTSNAQLNGARTYTGDTDILGGTLKIAQINTADESATYRLATGSTANLTFTGTDTIDKLFIDGTQQPAGVYGATGSGAQHETPLITGTGTLTVQSSPPGYTTWADQNAPGQPFNGDHDSDLVPNGIEYFMGETGSSFTMLPAINATGTITWPISSTYTGTYGTHFYLETSPDLFDWDPILIDDVTITPGTSISHTLPTTAPTSFIRLAVAPE
ncbi:MAG: sulfatase-like hydrolase/transferase [Verrucomicrobiaceae bacterium]